jgi:hypothetical protein
MTDRLSLPQEIAEGLARITEAARRPFGPPSFRWLVKAHIAVFVELRRQGASWSQIGALLAERGITGKDGQPIADGVLRATVSAARRAADSLAPEAGERTEDTTRGERKHRKALGQDKRSQTQRPETRRSEMQQHRSVPQQDALNRHPREPAATPRNRRQVPAQNELILPAVPPRPASGCQSRPLLPLGDALLRRAESIQKFHKPEND